MKEVMLEKRDFSSYSFEDIVIKNLLEIFEFENIEQEKLKKFVFHLKEDFKNSNINIVKDTNIEEKINHGKEIDIVLEKIENNKISEIQSFINQLNYVGEEGESIISFILRNSDFSLKNIICSQELKKQYVSDDVKITINSAMSYTEMPIEEVKDLIGHVFYDSINDFGVC